MRGFQTAIGGVAQLRRHPSPTRRNHGVAASPDSDEAPARETQRGQQGPSRGEEALREQIGSRSDSRVLIENC
jgi:hypothetical protein